MKFDEKVMQDVHKITYLAQEYPDKKLTDLAAMFEIAPLDFNAAMWIAQDLGYIHFYKKSKNGKLKVKEAPEKWVFGENVERLKAAIPFVLGKIAEDESDMESEVFNAWCQSYFTQDRFIAMKQLMNEGVISEYTVEDIDHDEDGKEYKNEYVFYTLTENLDKQWGKKQFKDAKKLQIKNSKEAK